jgi:group I intron endonuclease
MIGIYKITSPTNRVYIGSSNDISNRWCSYKNLKCLTQTKLYRSFLKHGVDNHVFEIIEECEVNQLLEKERYYGEKFFVLTKSKGLNCRLPKLEEFDNCMSQETKNKIGASNKGRFKGYKFGHYESKLKTLTIDNVIEIKKLLVKNELTQKQIGDLYGVSRKIIGNINTGKTYNTIGLDINLSKSKKKHIKLSEKDYITIKKLNKEGMTQIKIAKIYNVTQSHISKILNDENYIKSLKSDN